LPELASKDVSLDAGNLEQEPVTRYRLQVIKKTILKIIKDPNRPAFRTENGKSVWEMARDFTNRHQIVGWREELPGGIVRLFTLDFADHLFTTLDISPARSDQRPTSRHDAQSTISFSKAASRYPAIRREIRVAYERLGILPSSR
jgi:hypothetical protein